jgi:hypothetical protein
MLPSPEQKEGQAMPSLPSEVYEPSGDNYTTKESFKSGVELSEFGRPQYPALPSTAKPPPEADAIADALSRRAKKLLKKPCPAVGEGVHKWIFYAAATLAEAGLTDEQAEPIIEELCSRDSKHNEITDALKAARGERSSSTPRWAGVNPATIAEAAKNGPTLSELIDRSPEKIQFGEESQTEKYIDALFPGNPFLCIGSTKDCFHTARLSTLRVALPLHRQALIVPSPMTSKTGVTQKGEVSEHTLSNTGERRFLVCEFDKGGLDQHAAILRHLALYAPMVLVVFSGSKSLHGWFDVQAEEEKKVEKFFNYAASLGADPATWLRSQFVRMPDGKRNDNKVSDALELAGVRGVTPKRQAVLYFNPEAIR